MEAFIELTLAFLGTIAWLWRDHRKVVKRLAVGAVGSIIGVCPLGAFVALPIIDPAPPECTMLCGEYVAWLITILCVVLPFTFGPIGGLLGVFVGNRIAKRPDGGSGISSAFMGGAVTGFLAYALAAIWSGHFST